MAEAGNQSGRSSLDRGRSSFERPGRLSIAESVESVSREEKSTRPGHQTLVFPDPVALRYLEEDSSTMVLERRRRLEGYEIYLVEQWACSRSHPTFIIATYTGDMSQSIMVGVLSVPTEEAAWSSRLKVYFQAIQQFHARRKETPLGTLMVTNLSGFPSALSVIPIPDGDIRAHRRDFFVNEDLKRMGCSGRAGLQLQPPAPSTQAKYWHVYHTSDKVPLYQSVVELVILCQLALVIFDKLKPAFADGLLCDVTEKALADWWSDIGTDMFNLEPNDGILGPSTVSAILGILMGSHNRLKAAGAPVTKDPFDVSATKRAIEHFQKAYKLPRSRRLDRQTIDKLQRVTAKAASGEGWMVPRAVKSTVAELSGKGGEMVMGMVGARDKAGISEVETLDIERFSQLVFGARARWLWQGKPIKSGTMDLSRPEERDIVFAKDDEGGFMWTSRRRDTIMDANRNRVSGAETLDEPAPSTDPRSGLDRFKDRVGKAGARPHQLHHRHLKDLAHTGSRTELERDDEQEARLPLFNRQETDSSKQEDAEVTAAPKPVAENNLSRQILSSNDSQVMSPDIIVSQAEDDRAPTPVEQELGSRARSLQRDRSLGIDIDIDKYEGILPSFSTREPKTPYLRRSRSGFTLRPVEVDGAAANRLPRHLSFSFIEDTILGGDDFDPDGGQDNIDGKAEPAQRIKKHEIQSKKKYEISKKILQLEQATLPWTVSNVELVEDLEELKQRHNQELSSLYHERLDSFLTLQSHSTDLVREERFRLEDAVRRVDVLGAKLDYELNALESRIEDVEDGVADFENSIVEIESRIDDLVRGGPGSRSWVSWFPSIGKK